MVAFTHLAPSWFVGYDIFLEGMFALITLAVSFLAFKIYRQTSEKRVKLLSQAFFFIAISYLFQSFFNGLMLVKATERIPLILKIKQILLFQAFGVYLQILFMMVGLAILLYMTFKTEKRRIFWFLLTVTILPLLFIPNPFEVFFLFSTLYLGFILWHFIDNYREHRQAKTLLVTLAFLFLLIGKAHFLVAVNHQVFYVIGHLLELIAYLLILANLLLVLRK